MTIERVERARSFAKDPVEPLRRSKIVYNLPNHIKNTLSETLRPCASAVKNTRAIISQPE